MSKHTPGPWKFETVRTQSGICHKIGPFPPRPHHMNSISRHACLYADYPSSSDPADKELEANARLIAAAPDLLEVAEHCLEMLMRYEINRIDGEEISEEAIGKLRAAIAKAKGEQE